MKATCKDFIKFYNTANSYSIRWHTFYLYYLKIEAVSVSNELLLNMQRGILHYFFFHDKIKLIKHRIWRKVPTSKFCMSGFYFIDVLVSNDTISKPTGFHRYSRHKKIWLVPLEYSNRKMIGLSTWFFFTWKAYLLSFISTAPEIVVSSIPIRSLYSFVTFLSF
jgi:hypothetical protein